MPSIQNMEGGRGAAALSYMCLKDISEKRIALNIHSMQNILNMEGGRSCAVLMQNIQTHSLEYAFYAKYAKYGGGVP